MGNFKMSKLYTAIITIILLCVTILSGKAYGKEITERHVWDSAVADLPLEYKKPSNLLLHTPIFFK